MNERAAQRLAKRSIDLVVGAVSALVFTPVMLVLAVCSAVTYRANPVFLQDRVGRGGRRFRLIKLRSLPLSTPLAADKYELSSVSNARYGRLIRHSHLDELPQLWLVVTGRMSLVGPRPEMPDLVTGFDPQFASRRARMKPGCTGLWQISDASVGLIREHPEFDLHFVEHWTLRLDLWIMLRTLLQALGAERIHALAEVPRWTGSRCPSPTVAGCGCSAPLPGSVAADMGANGAQGS